MTEKIMVLDKLGSELAEKGLNPMHLAIVVAS